MGGSDESSSSSHISWDSVMPLRRSRETMSRSVSLAVGVWGALGEELARLKKG